MSAGKLNRGSFSTPPYRPYAVPPCVLCGTDKKMLRVSQLAGKLYDLCGTCFDGLMELVKEFEPGPERDKAIAEIREMLVGLSREEQDG